MQRNEANSIRHFFFALSLRARAPRLRGEMSKPMEWSIDSRRMKYVEIEIPFHRSEVRSCFDVPFAINHGYSIGANIMTMRLNRGGDVSMRKLLSNYMLHARNEVDYGGDAATQHVNGECWFISPLPLPSICVSSLNNCNNEELRILYLIKFIVFIIAHIAFHWRE